MEFYNTHFDGGKTKQNLYLFNYYIYFILWTFTTIVKKGYFTGNFRSEKINIKINRFNHFFNNLTNGLCVLYNFDRYDLIITAQKDSQ